MTVQRFRGAARIAAAFLFVVAFVTFGGFAATASAQTGQVRGKVVDAKGEPVADATVTIDFKGNITREQTTKTDKRGGFIQVGLQPGPYEITVTKGDLTQTLPARVRVGGTLELEFMLVPGAAPGMSPEEAKNREAMRKALEEKFLAGVALIDAGEYDEGIVVMNAVIAETGGCAICDVKIGDALFRKGDEAAAEEAYKKAIAADPRLTQGYAQLANLYNKQKKFDEAAEMSKKATEADAGSAGGGSAAVVFNQGIIFWNQSKVPEARAQFERAITMDPTLADAHYWLGMALVNEGKLPEAVTAFEKYLELAPTGQHADTAKGILSSIR